jgi:dCMP deaminase
MSMRLLLRGSVDSAQSKLLTNLWNSTNRNRCKNEGLARPNFEDFVKRSDDQLYGPGGLASLCREASLQIINGSASLSSLNAALRSLGLSNESLVRPNWDQYFMQLASLASHRSNCMKRRVGCVLIREKRVISTGYNGTPRGMKNCSEGGCK